VKLGMTLRIAVLLTFILLIVSGGCGRSGGMKQEIVERRESGEIGGVFGDGAGSAVLGKYFGKREWDGADLPSWEMGREKLPRPVLEGNPEWVELYWAAWELAFRGLKQPPEGSPLVSNWLDEAFSENIFQWDTIFMMMFARYGHQVFPAIESLDNFYRLQYESGFIGREFRERDGRLIHFDFDGGLFSEKGWKNMINPPLFSWAELENYRLSGDKSRFGEVLPVLEKYAEWLNRDGDPEAPDWENNGRRSASSLHDLYWNTPLGSGMDNTPRPADKGAGWVEMSSQMVIMYNAMAEMAMETGQVRKAEDCLARGREIGERINRWCWNAEDGFYYDVLADGSQYRVKTSGGFWPLLAGIADSVQAEALVEHLKDENEFRRLIPFPTLAADEEGYSEFGDYWKGAVWAPTNVMIFKGLETYGYEELAAEAAEKYLRGMAEVYRQTGSIYENYAPDHFLPGDPAKADFVGWSGCGPIQILFENIIGLRPDAGKGIITWHIRREDFHGVEAYPLGNNSISLFFEAGQGDQGPALRIESTEAFELQYTYRGRRMSVHCGGGELYHPLSF